MATNSDTVIISYKKKKQDSYSRLQKQQGLHLDREPEGQPSWKGKEFKFGHYCCIQDRK